ncbi:polymorphic toxin-type HINT domain-containing protein [Anaeromicropila populeti]|uniref:polymorphic toxin-type HINT domain-containing protein n=1 Tax=Anaeromicropila populeti TaxID=37658 RepID=UPI0015A70310|nr:polymorphic toxin-type HINT domain-containing protein [Anaeromicropila populeti]
MAGTLVLTEDGQKPIEEVKAGDIVQSENPETGEKACKKVVRTFVHIKDELIHVWIAGEEIITTREHPFYVEGKGFVGAGDLQRGDRVRLECGKQALVEQVTVEKLINLVKVYNFEVEDLHTYYVGEQSVLVHNMCSVESVPGKSGSKYYHVTTREAADEIIASGQLKNGKFESSVFAWKQQPTKSQAKLAGIGNRSQVVLEFETSASFSIDTGVNESLYGLAVRTSEGTRLPLRITNIQEVGFKKAWWQFWK